MDYAESKLTKSQVYLKKIAFLYKIEDGKIFSKRGEIKFYLKGVKNREYPYICAARIDGKNNWVTVHRIVAYQKFGDKIFEKGTVVRHLNGNKLDFSFNNIEIGSYRDNILDIPKEIFAENMRKTHLKARKLTVDQVLEIKKLLKEGELSHLKIAKMFNISDGSIYTIAKGKSYKEI